MYICKKCKQTYSTVRDNCDKCGGPVEKRFTGLGRAGFVFGLIASVISVLTTVIYLIISYRFMAIPTSLFEMVVGFYWIIGTSGLACAIVGRALSSVAVKKGVTARFVSTAKTLCSASLIINVVGLIINYIDSRLLVSSML